MQWHFPKIGEFHCDTEMVLPTNSWSLYHGHYIMGVLHDLSVEKEFLLAVKSAFDGHYKEW